MLLLQNLIPDPSTKNLWTCRPAASKVSVFAGFTTPGFVSCEKVVGNIVYGMIATGRTPGFDEPFVFNLVTGLFVTIAGVTSANVPSSPVTSGDWVPPIIDVIGTKVVFAHAGFNGTSNFFGWIDIANAASPVWGAGNTAPIALISVPISVCQFGQRAYFICNPPGAQPGLFASDVLLPTQITNANQILTFDDNTALTALAGLPLNSLTGGIIQALIVFKGTTNMYQVTGDYASTANPWSVNALNKATGTLSALSITSTPLGLAFVAPDGLRIIDFTAMISDPLGDNGEGIVVPFIASVTPSRVTAACNANTLRISVQNGNAPGSPSQEWWYHLPRKIWTGPHTFPASRINRWNNSFILTPVGVPGSLWQSDVVINAVSGFTENGVPLSWAWQTAMLPDPLQMTYCDLAETTVNVAFSSGAGGVTVNAIDETGSILGTFMVASAGSPTIWGAFIWGAAPWLGQSNSLHPRPVNWTQPIVFRRLAVQLTGVSGSGVKIGDLFMRYQVLNYLGP